MIAYDCVSLSDSLSLCPIKVAAEICENANATLRNNEIDADLVLALFSNSTGKVTLENNTSSSKAAQRRKATAASVLVSNANYLG